MDSLILTILSLILVGYLIYKLLFGNNDNNKPAL